MNSFTITGEEDINGIFRKKHGVKSIIALVTETRNRRGLKRNFVLQLHSGYCIMYWREKIARCDAF